MTPLGVAVVGLGWWGRTILALLQGSEKLRAVRAVDANPAAAVSAPAFSTDYEEALRDPAVGGVILCTPHSLHAAQIIQAANAKKHVFCEKPLSLSRADVLRAVKACNENRVALAVGHEKRFEPPIQELFRLAKGGELGTLLQIEANFSQDKFLSLAPDNWRISAKEAPPGR
jgi:predicted dehydrogenase